MLFMNEYEIEDAAERYIDHPTLGPATQTLADLCHLANRVSDGWTYWPAPVRAAQMLMALIPSRYDRTPTNPSAAAVRRAYGPINGFLTRRRLHGEMAPTRPLNHLERVA